MSLARIILYFLIGVFLAHIAFYYLNLPDTIALHFNAAGVPNGFMSKQNFFIFEGVMLLVIVFEFLLLPMFLRKMPDSLINIPNKKYWLAAGRRETAFLVIKKYFEWLSVALLCMFIAVNQIVFRANLTGQNLPGIIVWLILGLFILFTIAWSIKFVRQFKIREFKVN